MKHLTTVLFAIAFVLGLGSVAQATPPVFNGSVTVPTGGNIDATKAPITGASGGIYNPQPWATPMPASQTLIVWGDSIAQGIGATTCAGTGGYNFVSAPSTGTCFADKVANYYGFATYENYGIGGATLEHNGGTQAQWVDLYDNNTQGTTTGAVSATGSQTVSISLSGGSIAANEPLWIDTGANKELVYASSGSTNSSLTATFAKTHASGVTVSAAACLTCVAGANTWFVIQIGTNDDPISQFSPAAFTSTYASIINALISAGTPSSHIILNGVIFNTQNPATTATYTAAVMQAALITHTRFANAWAAMAPYTGTNWTGAGNWPYINYSDSLGLHPNDNGHGLIAAEDEQATFVAGASYDAMLSVAASFSINPWVLKAGATGGNQVIAYTGQVSIGTGTSTTSGDLGIGRANAAGSINFGGSSGGYFQYGVSGGAGTWYFSGGTKVAMPNQALNVGTGGASSAGDLGVGRSASAGLVNFAGHCNLDYGVTTASVMTAGCPFTSTGAVTAPSGSATACTGGFTFATSGVMVISGAGVPTCTAPAGSEYLRTDGTTGARLYISAGAGTWAAVSGV